jgi:cobalt-zinc-cadmium resistance protein CzcA
LVSENEALYYSKLLLGNYHSLLGEYTKFYNSLEYYEKQAVPEARLIIDQATRSYQAGAMDYLDYILNLNRALSIRQNYLDALNNFNQTIISIDFISGKIF